MPDVTSLAIKDRPPSIFACRIKLLKEWYAEWTEEEKQQLLDRLKSVDEKWYGKSGLNGAINGLANGEKHEGKNGHVDVMMMNINEGDEEEKKEVEVKEEEKKEIKVKEEEKKEIKVKEEEEQQQEVEESEEDKKENENVLTEEIESHDGNEENGKLEEKEVNGDSKENANSGE
jgi:hypothetical protein